MPNSISVIKKSKVKSQKENRDAKWFVHHCITVLIYKSFEMSSTSI
jgi:hypothetical protein